jgi:hypothetical protein
MVQTVNKHAASLLLLASKPIHAAAQLLTIGDVKGAISTLSMCGEDDLAYAVAICLDMTADQYLIDIADKMASSSGVEDALELLGSLRDTEESFVLEEKG